MASSVALSEAQANLPELLDRAESGEEIVISREGKAGMRIVPVANEVATVGKRVFGQKSLGVSYIAPGFEEPMNNAERKPDRRIGGQNLLGITYIAPDFDAPLSDEELKEWGY